MNNRFYPPTVVVNTVVSYSYHFLTIYFWNYYGFFPLIRTFIKVIHLVLDIFDDQ